MPTPVATAQPVGPFVIRHKESPKFAASTSRQSWTIDPDKAVTFSTEVAAWAVVGAYYDRAEVEVVPFPTSTVPQ